MLRLAIALTLAAKALLAAYAAEHGSASPPTTGLELAMGWSIGCEGAWTGYFRGTNNYGAVHASQGFADKYGQVLGYGMVAMLESHGAGQFYIAQMKGYPSLQIGAADFLRHVEYGVDLASVQNATDFSTQMYAVGYFEGPATPRTPLPERKGAIANGALTAADKANIAGGGACLQRTMDGGQPQSAVAGASSDPGDPTALTFGVGGFASLADRLTPGPMYAPHTIEHATTLLGDRATTPAPGGVTLADCLATPNGDGVWAFAPHAIVEDSSAGASSGGSVAVPVIAGVAAGAFAGALVLVARALPSGRRVRA